MMDLKISESRSCGARPSPVFDSIEYVDSTHLATGVARVVLASEGR